ncbi:hypothetical protein M501DRAFT_996188 [Patellaria atrata CBS 101060]|uniref:MARVEL domain-containing protein n=1 Tax=Patellaria atrata CBS 101060 TaxID=1346257 RepID=A0A9P4VMU9_9PEZI|nr:hypothetical protein M501DRAFT_996188 [Patellaria atrata CBS 101060]
MGISGFLFISWRLAEIVTLIPTLGMMAYFVHGYIEANQLQPTSILLLFIASVLAAAWAIATLFAYAKARHSAMFVATVDLCFVGLFIAAVYYLRGIARADCSNFRNDRFFASLGILGYSGTISGYKPSFHINKHCAMLKACFAFGIMNCIFFFITFLLALLVHRNHRKDDVVVKRERHVTRHGHRGSREYHSSSPRRSHHSSRRQYYV